jgi:hypothetical protein
VDEAFLETKRLSERLPDIGRWFHDDDGSVADW